MSPKIYASDILRDVQLIAARCQWCDRKAMVQALLLPGAGPGAVALWCPDCKENTAFQYIVPEVKP